MFLYGFMALSHRYRGFDARVALIINELKVLEAELKYILDFRVKLHSGKRVGFALKLRFNLLVMILVYMNIAVGVNVFAWFESGNLRHHHSQQRMLGNIERSTQKHIVRTHIVLTREASVFDI